MNNDRGKYGKLRHNVVGAQKNHEIYAHFYSIHWAQRHGLIDNLRAEWKAYAVLYIFQPNVTTF